MVQFSGPLSRIQTHGSIDVDSFQLDGTGHAIQLAATFAATVNGTNGDVFLNPVVARYRRTEIQARGWIRDSQAKKAKRLASTSPCREDAWKICSSSFPVPCLG